MPPRLLLLLPLLAAAAGGPWDSWLATLPLPREAVQAFVEADLSHEQVTRIAAAMDVAAPAAAAQSSPSSEAPPPDDWYEEDAYDGEEGDAFEEAEDDWYAMEDEDDYDDDYSGPRVASAKPKGMASGAGKPKPKAKDKTKTKTETKAKTEAEDKTETKPKTQAKPKTQDKTQAKPKTQDKTQAKPKAQDTTQDHLQEQADRLEDLLLSTPAGPDATTFHFQLARLWDELGEPEEAFRHARRGNRDHRRAAGVDATDEIAFATGMAAAYPRERYASLPRASAAERSEQPVFIVGLPRSGTTLVEQMLSMHPDVHALGEVPYFGDMVRELYEAALGANGGDFTVLLTQESVDAFARRGLAEMRRLAGAEGAAAKRVVDKKVYNGFHVGFIPLAYPDARIVHVVRDPRDVMLSAYFQQFSDAHLFSFQLDTIVSFIDAYLDLMRHWTAELGIEVHELRYEDLVAAPEAEARRLLDYLGLRWDPAVLRFHESERVPHTASDEQVRRPLYASSVGKWALYHEWLRDFIGPLTWS